MRSVSANTDDIGYRTGHVPGAHQPNPLLCSVYHRMPNYVTRSRRFDDDTGMSDGWLREPRKVFLS
jgi:hypothetical protein